MQFGVVRNCEEWVLDAYLPASYTFEEMDDDTMALSFWADDNAPYNAEVETWAVSRDRSNKPVM